MGKPAFTPGPWKVGYDDGSGINHEVGCFTITAPKCTTVVWSGESFGMVYGVRSFADASLIAAAPDGYEFASSDNWQTIQRCIDGLSETQPPSALWSLLLASFDVLLCEREAYLAKAEGR